MSVDRLAASLLMIATEDLAAVRLLAPTNNRNAVYLLEQAAEKIIRAVLTHSGTHAGISHHLDEMVDRIADTNPLKPALRSIEHLGAYATSYRYPTSTGRVRTPPSTDELAANIATVERVLRTAANHLGVTLS